MLRERKLGWHLSVAALACGLAVAGCATKEQRLGADIDSDACKTYKVALDSTGNFFEEDMVKGAVVGALGGALMGGLIGGDWTGAVAGAVAGAAVGAATGYWQYKQQQAQDQAVLYASVLTDLQAENAQIDKSQLAFDQLTECRRNEANKLRADVQAGRLGRETAEARMADLRRRYQSDIELARLINENIQERSANFGFANQQVNPNSDQLVAQIAEQKQVQLASARRPTTTAKPASTARPRRQQAQPKPQAQPAPVVADTPQEQVLVETASNQAKRNHFAESVDVAAAETGFLTLEG